MKVLIQRVAKSTVKVEGKVVSAIGGGLLALICIEKNDTPKEVEYIANKTAALRIFEDKNQRMNLSVKDIHGEIMAVPQFTLAANTARGNRPGFETAALPEKAQKFYELFIDYLRSQGLTVKKGIFQTHMEVELINDGPVTIMIEKNF